MKAWREGGSLVLIGLAILSLVSVSNAAKREVEPAKSFKPRAPIEIRLTLVDQPAAGQEALLDLEIKALMNLPAVQVTLTLPKSLHLTQGPTGQTENFLKGQTKRLQIRVLTANEGSYEMIATATARYPDGSRLSKATSLTLRVGSKENPPAIPPILKKSHDKKNVIEFKAE